MIAEIQVLEGNSCPPGGSETCWQLDLMDGPKFQEQSCTRVMTLPGQLTDKSFCDRLESWNITGLEPNYFGLSLTILITGYCQ